MATIVLDDQLLVPHGIDDLRSFCTWTHREDFPQVGRIDYISGRIEIDMSPEQLFAHGRLKTEFVASLSNVVQRSEWLICSDSTRVVERRAELSSEPDLVMVARDSIQNGRVRLIPKANVQNDFVEIEGAADIVIEIVSDSSVGKDTTRLPIAYFTAGIGEYWIADARHEELAFVIYRRGVEAFQPVEVTPDGWQFSPALKREFQLTRPVTEPDWVEFELKVR